MVESNELQGNQVIIRSSRALTGQEVRRLIEKINEELATLGLDHYSVWSGRENVQLSSRQRQLMVLISDGLSNSDIAERLGLKLSTVKNEITEVMYKLGAMNRAHAVVQAIKFGEIKLGTE